MDDCRRHIKKEIANLARRSAPYQTRKLAISSREKESPMKFTITTRKSQFFWRQFRRSSAQHTSQKHQQQHSGTLKQSPKLVVRSKSAFYRQMLIEEDNVNSLVNTKGSTYKTIQSKLLLKEASIHKPKRDLIQQHLFKIIRSGNHSPSNSEVYLESKMATTHQPTISQPFFKLYQV